VLVAVGLLGTAGEAQTQGAIMEAVALPAEDGAGSEPRTFGTSATTSHTMQAFGFTGFDAADDARIGRTAPSGRFCTAPCNLAAPLLLPAGARVTAVELDACDSSAVGSVAVSLIRVGRLGSVGFLLAGVTTGDAPAAGCAATMLNFFGTPPTIDNLNNAYFVQVTIGGTDSTTRFQAVRVFYALQVSPAPAMATFSDVPTTHPFFQFIEALAASGITSGCGGGNFCPDAPLTRGQMAVFLSLGLGLHFAP
jgi:hypothetical protein